MPILSSVPQKLVKDTSCNAVLNYLMVQTKAACRVQCFRTGATHEVARSSERALSAGGALSRCFDCCRPQGSSYKIQRFNSQVKQVT